MLEVVVIGGGIAGMSTAARLQAAGLSTLVLEAHGLVGGCAGYFRRQGFAFDVGATTLVDFGPEGVGGELLGSIGMPSFEVEVLPGYVAWLPDRRVTLHRDPHRWHSERLATLGDSARHRQLWQLFDRVAGAFWRASRRGIRLPMLSVADAWHNLRALGLADLPLARYLTLSLGQVLRQHQLRDDRALCGLLAMLVEDTVHSGLDEAPFINAVLGTTIRGSGLARAEGGMFGFWRNFLAHYRRLGGQLRVGTRVERVRGHHGNFRIQTQRGELRARHVVFAVPAALTARLAQPEVGEALRPYLERDAEHQGSAAVVFLGVPDAEVEGQDFTHHQLLTDYTAPLGNGNNMFISVSRQGDTQSAPAGQRAVMISTHTDLVPWEGLTEAEYRHKKRELGQHLLNLARRIYPNLGQATQFHQVATPRTYERYTRRPRGAVGGLRLSLSNANQHAVPHELGLPGVWLCGDTTWPGLGTVACVLGSRIVANSILHTTAARLSQPAALGSEVPHAAA